MALRKRKRKDWELFPPKNGAKRPRYKYETLKKEKVDPLYYYMFDKFHYRRCIKPKHIKFVQQNVKLQPYLTLFRKIAVNAKSFCKIYDKNKLSIFEALHDIIPDNFFGSRQNRKHFYKFVNIFLTCTINECRPAVRIIGKYKMEEIPWLKDIKSIILRRRYLYKAVLWLLEKIVQPIAHHLYYILKKTNTRDIVYYPKYAWSSFKQKALHELKKQKCIISAGTVSTDCVIGTLQVVPKGSLTELGAFRPVIKTKRLKKINHKPLLIHVKKYMQQICQTKTINIYYPWKNYLKKVGDKQIYAMKVDVSNGYTNTNLEFLEEKIKESKGIPMHMKKVLLDYINNQYVEITFKSKSAAIYKWNRGLIQGGQLSGVLYNLFMCYVDILYLNDFYKPNCFLHRVVDDYLFCSTELKDVERFLNKISLAHNLNKSKLMSNIEPFNNEEIVYCGKVFNMKTYEIRARYEFDSIGNFHHKYKIWDNRQFLTKEAALAKVTDYRCNCSHFNKVELNTQFNSEATVMHNFFQAMLLLAFKFDAVVYTIYNRKDMELYGHIITQTVWYYSHKVLRIITKLKGKYFKDNITFGLLIKVSYSAFKHILDRRHNMYKPLAIEIRKCLKRIRLENWHNFGNNLNLRTVPDPFKKIKMARKLVIMNV